MRFTTSCLITTVVLGSCAPASAQVMLQESSAYPSGLPDQFPAASGQISHSGLLYAFSLMNVSAAAVSLTSVTLPISLIGIQPSDFTWLDLQQNAGGFSSVNGSIVGSNIVFSNIAIFVLPPGIPIDFFVRHAVENLAAGDEAIVDLEGSGVGILNGSGAFGDAAPVRHVVEPLTAVPALGVGARSILVFALAGLAVLAMSGRRPR